jgi:hypothetical protein
MRRARIAACAAAVCLGAGIVTGTGLAAADNEPDPTGPPSDGTNVLGPTVNAATGVVTGITGALPLSPDVQRTLNQTVISLGRIATNHSLTTARLV